MRPLYRGLAAALLALLAAPAGAQPVLIKMATLVPDGSSWHLILKQTAEEWKRLSGGKVSVRLYAGGVAGDDPDVVRKMRLGTLNAGVLTAVGIAEIDKSVYALGVPMLYDSYEEVYWVLEKMRPRLEKSVEEKGFVVLNWADAGWVRFFSAKPVARPDDLRALKLFSWAGDSAAIEIWKSAGFNPVPLPSTEINTALRTGLVTALGSPPQVAVISQFFKDAPNMTDMRWQMLLGATVIKKDVWERIPAELRPALLEATRQAGERLQADVRGSEAKDIEAMQARGLKVVPVDAAARALWLRTAEGLYPRIRGPIVPADAFDEARQFRDEYRRSHPAGR
ncbi:MAG: TRAP transporter substrate-binding protein DctP [Vicinamibacteria bacterium]